MAHVRKDTIVSPVEWAKHLRPFGKRMQARAERRASQGEITDEMVCNDEPSKKLGLHNDPKKMAKLKAEKGESVVPRGMYCYDDKGNCQYWDKAENAEKQCNGYCWLLGKGDWDEGIGEIWDQCKNCGIKNGGESPFGTLDVEDE